MCTSDDRTCRLSHFSAGLVIAYMANTNARVAVNEMPEKVDSALEDVQTYLATLQRVSGAHTHTHTHTHTRARARARTQY